MSNLQYEHRAIAFIDILGFSSIIKGTEGNNDKLEELSRAMNNLFERKKINDDDKLMRREITVFSDSIVISYPVNEPASIFYLIMDIIHLQLDMLQHNILLRGAVTHGDLHHEDDVVIGPAMIKAYTHESKVAVYPRIIVDSELLQIASKYHGPQHTAQKELEFINGFLKNDFDDELFIDFLSQWQELNYPEHDHQVLLIKIKDIIEANIKTDNKSIKVKYQWLKNYFNLVCKNHRQDHLVI